MENWKGDCQYLKVGHLDTGKKANFQANEHLIFFFLKKLLIYLSSSFSFKKSLLHIMLEIANPEI